MIDLGLWARRHGVVVSAVACLAVAIALRHWAQVTVDLPLGVRSTPLWICLPALTALLSLPVASITHSEIERQSPRLTRGYRCVTGLTSTGAAMAGPLVLADRPIATPVAAWTLGLCGCGLVFVVIAGASAWAPQALLAIGLTSVAAGGTGPALVSASADTTALLVGAVWWLAALAIYATVEPRSAVRRPVRPPRHPQQHPPKEQGWQPR